MKKFAYIKYRVTGETEIVETDCLQNFNESTHEATRCYYLNACTTTGDNERYKVQVILLGETREEVEQLMNGPSRVRIPKIVESEISSEETCMSESDDEVPPVFNDQIRSGKRKIDTADVTKNAKQKAAVEKAAVEKAKKTAMERIMRDRIENRVPVCQRSAATPPPPPPTPPPRKQAPGSGSSPVSNTTRAQSDEVNKENKKLREENEKLKEENDKLRETNLRLQGEVLDRFAAGDVPAQVGTQSQDDGPHLKLDYQPDNGKVSLGYGQEVSEESFLQIKSASTNSIFVKNLAISLYGSETLREGCLEGRACNRFKDRAVKPKLEAQKLMAIKYCFKNHLEAQPLSPADRTKELGKFKSYIREKIMDLNRVKKR